MRHQVNGEYFERVVVATQRTHSLNQKHIHARLRNDYDDDDDDDVKKERGAGNRNNETYYVNFVIELKRK